MVVIKFLFRFFAKLFGVPSFKLLWRQRYYLEDPKRRTRALKGPAIVISNHTHILDYFAMMFTHPFRKMRFLVSEAIFQHPFLGFMCRLMDDILVHRERSDLSFMAEAEKTLKKGGVVTIFPEGKLSHDGKLNPFKPAAVYLALRTGAPIVPHYVEPHYFKWKRTRIIVGKPIYLKDYCSSDNPSADEVRKICEMLQAKTNELKRKMSLYRKYKTRNIIYPKSWFLDLAKFVLMFVNWLVFPTKFHYLNGATPKDRKRIRGRALIASRHTWFNDPPILCMHYFSRRLRIIVGSDLYDNHKWLLKHLMSIRYDRVSSNSDPRCFLEVINLLKAEGMVGIYPAGHIVEEEKNEFHEGTAYFAIQGDAPVYFYYMMKPWKAFRINHVMIDKPIYHGDIYTPEELKDKATIAKYTEVLKERYFALEKEGQKYLEKKQKSHKK